MEDGMESASPQAGPEQQTIILQGDQSGLSLGYVDIKTRVAFWYMDLILKHKLCFDVNTTLGTT